ncbi:hypothetical protein EDS67_26035 [candidate division KSB1 bacterium]|nr:MAG: hypothetical protein EDS67_26035 [candidate division KSB1 bacterium]MBC6949905.1 hypothetical protein [candidate division KSB1 bacterium]MCE7944670.1 hypothetical protein [Chlorobi bacterium CHB1]MDL1878409.1 hypothetical protein [Cytophagia bacterium CHB2]
MYTVYRINANDLDNRFLKSLKALFKDKEIEIAISEAPQREDDETAYLLRSPENRERLLHAIENATRGRNMVTVEPDEWQ